MMNPMTRCGAVAVVTCLLGGCAADDGRRATITMTPERATTEPDTGPPAAAAAAGDPIDGLVERLSASRGLWKNGAFPALDLPATASTEQVVSRVFEMTGFDAGRVKEHRILETRQVRIPGSLPGVYTAVLMDTDIGRKIVLFQRGTGEGASWWSRVYDAPTPALSGHFVSEEDRFRQSLVLHLHPAEAHTPIA